MRMADEEQCTCGLGPGYTCHPDCPAYKEPPPGKIEGTVSVKGHVKSRAPDNGSYSTFQFATTDTAPIMLIGRDDNRCRLLVWSDAVVFIGRRDSIIGGGGARLSANTPPVVLKNADELWARPTGAAANISVVNERYNS